jgi:hypothetical protein
MAGRAGDRAGNRVHYEGAQVVSPSAIRDRMSERGNAGRNDGRSL